MTRQSQRAASACVIRCYLVFLRRIWDGLSSSLLCLGYTTYWHWRDSRAAALVQSLLFETAWDACVYTFFILFHPFSSVFIVFMLCSVASLWAPPRFLQTLYPDWCGPGNRNRSVNLQSKPELGSKRSSFVTACYAWKSQKMPEATLRFPMVIACIGEASYWTGTLGDAKRGECRIDSTYFNIKAIHAVTHFAVIWTLHQAGTNLKPLGRCESTFLSGHCSGKLLLEKSFAVLSWHLLASVQNLSKSDGFDMFWHWWIGWEVEWSGGVKLLGLLAELHGDAASNSEAARPGRRVQDDNVDNVDKSENYGKLERKVKFSPEPWTKQLCKQIWTVSEDFCFWYLFHSFSKSTGTIMSWLVHKP